MFVALTPGYSGALPVGPYHTLFGYLVSHLGSYKHKASRPENGHGMSLGAVGCIGDLYARLRRELRLQGPERPGPTPPKGAGQASQVPYQAGPGIQYVRSLMPKTI